MAAAVTRAKKLWRYFNQNNDLAELGQLLVGFRPDFVFMQDVAVFKERL